MQPRHFITCREFIMTHSPLNNTRSCHIMISLPVAETDLGFLHLFISHRKASAKCDPGVLSNLEPVLQLTATVHSRQALACTWNMPKNSPHTCRCSRDSFKKFLYVLVVTFNAADIRSSVVYNHRWFITDTRLQSCGQSQLHFAVRLFSRYTRISERYCHTNEPLTANSWS